MGEPNPARGLSRDQEGGDTVTRPSLETRWQSKKVEGARKLAAFDDLLAACEALVESFAPLELEGILVVRMDMLKTAIAKAKGAQR